MTQYITFNDLPAGTVIDDEFRDLGVSVSAAGGSGLAMIFDTSNPTGGDTDLATSNLGNVLIVSEDGDSSDPDDNAGGGALRFSFDEPVTVESLTVLDVEEGAWIKAFDAHGNQIGQFDVYTADNGQLVVDINLDGVAYLDVHLGGSGAIDNLAFTPPGPALDGIVEGTDEGELIDVAFDGDPDGDMVDAGDAILPGEAPDDDIITAGGGDDTVLAGAGDDDVYGEDGDDLLSGGDGHDFISGGDGDDTLIGGEGCNHLNGGLGNDVFIGGAGADSFIGDAGLDIIDYSASDGPIHVDLRTGFLAGGDAENDTIKQGIDGIIGTDFDDVLVGFDGFSTDPADPFTNVLDGGAGDDTIAGLGGPDSLFGGDDSDLIFGTAGDTVDGGAGGVDYDTLDLTDQGPFTVTDLVPDANGNGFDGTVVFLDSDGVPTGETLTFTEIEAVRGDFIDPAPVAADDVATTDEDTPVVIDVLANDSDPLGDPLEVTSATSPDGTVEINPDGTITFTPDENFFGETTIDVTITDPSGNTDTSTVTVTVNPVNDAPVAGDDVAEVPEDGSVVIPVLDNDVDVDGDPLTVTEASSPDGTVTINPDGTLTFEPAPDFTGPTTITYTITDPDGLTDTATVDVTVTPVDDAPVAADDVATTDEDTPVVIDLLANDTDPDGDPLAVTGATSPDGAVEINPDGTITFTPTENFFGDTTIDVTVTDPDGNTAVSTVFVTVNPVNDAPEANDDRVVTPFNTAVVVPVLANDIDVDGDPLEVVEATSPDGTVEINPDGTITFTPTDGFEGTALVSYTITDPDGLTDTATVEIVVEASPLDGVVTGTDGDDLIDVAFDGDPEGDMVDAGDAILPGEGPDDDIIVAGDGDDTVLAGAGDDEVFGGEGNDGIDGEDGDDVLLGEGGDDTLLGGFGGDTLLGGEGNDLIDAGSGDLLPDLGFPNDDGTPIPGFPFGFPADPDPLNDLDSVDGGAGDDTISTGDDADTIFGGTGADVIDGGIDDDEISGDEDDDRIVGGEGNDLIDGGTGDDTIFAGIDPDLGFDSLDIEDDGSNPVLPADPRPDNGRDTVFGGEGNDLIFGDDDDDELFGGEGDDTIDGEIDEDFIDGGEGNDSLLGGQGNDTILGGDGDDFIDGGFTADTLFGGDGNDTILGGNGDDEIDGGDGDDLIDGGTGGDSDLSGGAGNDTIFGGTGSDTIDGGDGNDEIDLGAGGSDDVMGGADSDTFLNVSAGDTIDGGAGGVDFDVLDLSGSTSPGGSLSVTITGPDSNGNGVDGFVTYFDADGVETGTLEFSEIEEVIPCFTPGTLIATPRGEVRVEDLTEGDLVITRDNGIQPVSWVGRRDMDPAEFAAKPELRPILIKRGALGNGLPERDMMVSPNHRVLVASDRAELLFEEREVLVAAKHLVGLEGVEVADVHMVSYVHIMFERHEVVLSDGAWTESFQPGDMSLKGVGDAQRAEILALFPELETMAGIDGYVAARRTLKKHEAALLRQ